MSCPTNVIRPDSINIDTIGLRFFPYALALTLVLISNPRRSVYTVMILYTIRIVTSALTPNDMKKNPVTAERYQLGRGRLSSKLLIWKPRVVNAVAMISM